jgi:glycosyltransferase involved in cell wall biosynthesis
MMPIKVLHLSSERTWRGGEQQIAYLIDELRKAGVQVAAAVRPGSAFETWCEKEGVPHFALGFSSGISLRSAVKLKKMTLEGGFDLVHVHSGKSHSIAYLAAVLGMQCPIVVHRRVDFPVGKNSFSLRKYNHPSVVGILCVSDAIASLVRSAVQRPERVKTIHSGIDFSRFQMVPSSGFLHKEFGIPRDKALVANISAIAPHKDYPTFVRTAAAVLRHRNDVHFLAVGSGELLQEIRQLAQYLGVDKNITFTGFRTDVPAILREIKIFLITSSTEGLGTSIIDAMHNAVPVVATRAGGIPELVVHEETGLLCDVMDAEGLANAVNRLIDEPALSARLGENAAKRSMLFSKQEMAQKVIDFYRSIP